MNEICLFAGTTEGRRLAEFLAGQPVRVHVCVATDYGESLLPKADNLEISAGRLDEGKMEALFEQRRFDLVIDATHPYAAEASEHIAGACRAAGLTYLRLNRGDQQPDPDAVYVDSIAAAAAFLADHPGAALLATGSKELAPYTSVPDYRDRFYVRVLPTAESLSACAAVGFAPAHVIAMQGPFSVEMNAATLKSIRAHWLVTKDSGEPGGFFEKITAARQAGARCIVVGRPAQREGMDYAGVVKRLMERYDLRDIRDIAVVGIGMGGPDSMTLEAEKAVRECDCAIGAKRMLESIARFDKPCFAEIAPESIAARIAEHPEYRRVAVLMSGDTGFFSGAKRLMPLLDGQRVRAIPGISSLQALCARLGTGWEGVKPVSLHGREGSIVPELRRCGRVFALLDGADAVKRLCADLIGAGMDAARLSVGQRLSYPDESILRGTAAELADAACDPLSAALIEYDASDPLPVGLPDGAFERVTGEGARPVPMTKSEVRAVIISKLRLTEDAVVWDVGAGTGSVSAEAALLCPTGRVFAVECREDAAALIERNARKLGIRNMTIVCGTAPEALAGLPAPTHAFIGGSGGHLREIVRAVLERNPNARIVVSAVSPESAGEIARIIREEGFADEELIQVTVARSRAAGRVHLMEGMNPVWIAAMQKGGEPGEG